MIFVTVGTQLPFDRLVKTVDDWVSIRSEVKVVVQSGAQGISPAHCESCNFIKPEEWEQLFNEAELVVAHAGMGTILKAIERGKPTIIMPRISSLGEHRNDHQAATVKRLTGYKTIKIVNSEEELKVALDNPPRGDILMESCENTNLNNLIQELKTFALKAY